MSKQWCAYFKFVKISYRFWLVNYRFSKITFSRLEGYWNMLHRLFKESLERLSEDSSRVFIVSKSRTKWFIISWSANDIFEFFIVMLVGGSSCSCSIIIIFFLYGVLINNININIYDYFLIFYYIKIFV